MRVWVAVGCLLLVGCVGPHSTGALWAQQAVEQENAMFRSTDGERAARARAFELALADEVLAAEQARLTGELQLCPGTAREALALSPADRARDGLRVRVQADTERQSRVAQVALADWQLRRGRATGDSQFCEAARLALTGQGTAPASGSPLVDQGSAPPSSFGLEQLGSATVSRDPRGGSAALVTNAGDALATLSLYALGAVDGVTAEGPLPQYLAAVYGGQLVPSGSTRGPLLSETPELAVDRLAPTYPQWEPDALYEALRAR